MYEMIKKNLDKKNFIILFGIIITLIILIAISYKSDKRDIKNNNIVKAINENSDVLEDIEEEDENHKEEVDDDIQVVKSSIYKYHGDLNYKQQVKGDYFNFKYFDDFEDNDDVILMEEEYSEDLETEEGIEPEPMIESDDTGEKINNKKTESENIPVQKMEMKQFPGGNFFMVAC